MTPEERADWVRAMGARTDWWLLGREPVVAPEAELVDAHFHLWQARTLPDPQDSGRSLQTSRYLLDEFRRDTGGGHRVVQCVYVECGTAYRTEGPENLRPVGETAFVADLARQGGAPQIAAMVAHADLRDPDLDLVLDAHAAAGGGLVRGIRHAGARLEDPAARLIAGAAPRGLYADPAFRRGVARLGERGLVFDAFQFHFQAEQLVALAQAVPGTTFVVNHLGTPVGYAGPPTEADPVFTAWRTGIEDLARLPNIIMKLGGLASVVTGYDGGRRQRPPGSETFVAERGAYFHHAIRCLGPERCMFESNWPVDSVSIGYAVLWNAYKRIALDYGPAAQAALLAGTARRVYRIRPPAA
ncbi:amidohydrolase family protein [Marinibaculum pumilum]|uniref:Amidohydrolase family protein n=1 Tax=Marinibaculum pumilum TaxID=1766165 RepID=A0ABV7KX14_9PROT